jgi:hypothetical protein
MPRAGWIWTWMMAMAPNEMLQALSQIWLTCAKDYPKADHEAILKHIEALQLLIFGLR